MFQRRGGLAAGIALGVLAMVAGCEGSPGTGTDGGPGVEMPVPGECEVGGGAGFFDPLVEGEALQMYLGPQGGRHVYAGVRVRGLDLRTIEILVTVEDTFYGSDVVLPALLRSADLVTTEDGWSEALDVVLFVEDPDWLAGREAVLRAEAYDAAGGEAVDERLVLVRN